MNKNLLIAIACILSVLSVLAGVYINGETQNSIEKLQDIVVNQIQDLEEQEEQKITEEKSNNSTIEIEDLSEEEEHGLEMQETEAESFELQGNIAYEGEQAKNWNVELGDYAGLTYYSQVDSRWKNHTYTSINDKSQTIGSSGCGPTSAAMIVSSIKGNISPDTMRRFIC